MFMCVYQKADNIVVEIRNDTSVPQTTTAEQYFNDYCVDNNVDPAQYNYAEMPYQKIGFNIGEFSYNQATNSIVVNPDWIPPAAVETSSIPVSDPAGGSNA
jgi:hypothetical protein